MTTFENDIDKYKDEAWTKEDLIQGLKDLSEFTGRASVGVGFGLAAALGLGFISGGLLAPWSGVIAVNAMQAAWREYDEASPEKKRCMRIAGRLLTGRLLI